MDLTVRYLLLRDDLDWIGDIAGLTRAADGTLSLTRVPAPASDAPVMREGPFEAEPSGIAVDSAPIRSSSPMRPRIASSSSSETAASDSRPRSARLLRGCSCLTTCCVWPSRCAAACCASRCRRSNCAASSTPDCQRPTGVAVDAAAASTFWIAGLHGSSASARTATPTPRTRHPLAAPRSWPSAKTTRLYVSDSAAEAGVHHGRGWGSASTHCAAVPDASRAAACHRGARATDSRRRCRHRRDPRFRSPTRAYPWQRSDVIAPRSPRWPSTPTAICWSSSTQLTAMSASRRARMRRRRGSHRSGTLRRGRAERLGARCRLRTRGGERQVSTLQTCTTA